MLKSMQELLEYGFECINEHYFNSQLPPIVITIMSSPRSNGHFTVGKEWRLSQDRLNEINISAEHLDRPVENIMATLCHECVHYYCQLNGIKDVSSNGRYHNGKFKEEGEKRGLILTYDKYIGWSITQPSEEFIEFIHQCGIEKPIDINRDGALIDLTTLIGLMGGVGGVNGLPGQGQMPTGRKKTSTRKYICPNCGNTFRATKDINVLCMDCDIQFEKVER